MSQNRFAALGSDAEDNGLPIVAGKAHTKKDGNRVVYVGNIQSQADWLDALQTAGLWGHVEARALRPSKTRVGISFGTITMRTHEEAAHVIRVIGRTKTKSVVDGDFETARTVTVLNMYADWGHA